MNTLNEAAKRANLIEKLQTTSKEIKFAADVRGQPTPSMELLREAYHWMVVAADYIENLEPPQEAGGG